MLAAAGDAIIAIIRAQHHRLVAPCAVAVFSCSRRLPDRRPGRLGSAMMTKAVTRKQKPYPQRLTASPPTCRNEVTLQQLVTRRRIHHQTAIDVLQRARLREDPPARRRPSCAIRMFGVAERRIKWAESGHEPGGEAGVFGPAQSETTASAGKFFPSLFQIFCKFLRVFSKLFQIFLWRFWGISKGWRAENLVDALFGFLQIFIRRRRRHSAPGVAPSGRPGWKQGLHLSNN